MRSQLSLMWLAAMTAAASAMPLDGTISTSFQPNMENGNLVGCSIIYSVLDHPEIFEKIDKIHLRALSEWGSTGKIKI